MNILDLNLIYRTFQAALNCPNRPVRRIVIDSRDIQVGDVFFAIQGERFDGHDYVDDVLAKGALLAVTSRADFKHKKGCLNVADTEQALGELAKAWRIKNKALVLGITGSSGKTTVKEMAAAVLRHTFGNSAVLATEGNLNNHLGVPLTLLKLTPEHRFAVVEMGMNHTGELAYLSDIAKPDIALINNVLHAHIGCGFDSLADIARAKSEIYTGLPENGMAIYPAKNEYQHIFQVALKQHQSRTFGVVQGNIYAKNIELQACESRFTLCLPEVEEPVRLPAPGKHNISNALAVAALLADWVLASDIANGLAKYQPVGSRLRILHAACGARLIDDSYNANPDSMKAALDVLAAFDAPRCFVMGDMGELGEFAPELHYQVGEYARELGIENALFLGENAFQAACAFGEGGLYFPDKSSLIKQLKKIIFAKSTVLLKGSRFMKMEEVVDALLDTKTTQRQ